MILLRLLVWILSSTAITWTLVALGFLVYGCLLSGDDAQCSLGILSPALGGFLLQPTAAVALVWFAVATLAPQLERVQSSAILGPVIILLVGAFALLFWLPGYMGDDWATELHPWVVAGFLCLAAGMVVSRLAIPFIRPGTLARIKLEL